MSSGYEPTVLGFRACSLLADGRAYFTIPNLFRASFSLTGAQKAVEGESEEERASKVEQGKDGGTWYLVDLEFLFGVGRKEEAEDIERGTVLVYPSESSDPSLECQLIFAALLQISLANLHPKRSTRSPTSLTCSLLHHHHRLNPKPFSLRQTSRTSTSNNKP
jgi:hypothetical protein